MDRRYATPEIRTSHGNATNYDYKLRETVTSGCEVCTDSAMWTGPMRRKRICATQGTLRVLSRERCMIQGTDKRARTPIFAE